MLLCSVKIISSLIAQLSSTIFRPPYWCTMSERTSGLLPATSRCTDSRGQVQVQCELAIFATKSSRRDYNLVPATTLTNSNGLNFLGKFPRLVPQNALCELFVGHAPATSPSV